MSENNTLFRMMFCGASSVLTTVSLYENEWNHIQANHGTVKLDHLVNAIEQPLAAYQDHLRPTGVLFVGANVDLRSGHPIRVAVKRLPQDNFVSTAWYSSKQLKGILLWKQGDET
jgi:hypothetical protein